MNLPRLVCRVLSLCSALAVVGCGGQDAFPDSSARDSSSPARGTGSGSSPSEGSTSHTAPADPPPAINRAKWVFEATQTLFNEATGLNDKFVPSLIAELAAISKAAGTSTPVTHGTATARADGTFAYSSSPANQLLVKDVSGYTHTWSDLQISGDISNPDFPNTTESQVVGSLKLDGTALEIRIELRWWQVKGVLDTTSGPMNFHFVGKTDDVTPGFYSFEYYGFVALGDQVIEGNQTIGSANLPGGYYGPTFWKTYKTRVAQGADEYFLDADTGWHELKGQSGRSLDWQGKVTKNGVKVGGLFAPVLVAGNDLSDFGERINVEGDVYEVGHMPARNDSKVDRAYQP